MRRIAAILCSAAILASYPGIAALGQEPEIAIPVGAGVSGSSLFGQEEGWTGGDVQAAGDARAAGDVQASGDVQTAGDAQAAPADQSQAAVQIAAPSAILMEASTGQVIYEKDADEKRSPASVTKVMTLILIFDALQSGKIQLTDEVVTSAHAKSMGGSQVFLEEGEKQTVETLIKCIVIASGNDASVAMAEYIAGSEDEFVRMMNERAASLGMSNTHFVDCCGLTESPDHYTTARDIAIMSRELILNHPDIRNFTTIWMDSIRGGQFQLANTNKLVRFYEGATGLKTGSTDAAGYCLSATAERDGMELIAVVLKAKTSEQRFESAKSLLNFGFANYTLTDVYPGQALPPVDVLLGEQDTVQPVLAQSSRILVDKAQLNDVTSELRLCENVEAPVEQGQKLGEMVISVGGQEQQTIPIVADRAVARLTLPGIFSRFLKTLFMAE